MGGSVVRVTLLGGLIALAGYKDEVRSAPPTAVSDSAGVRVVTNNLSDPLPACTAKGPTVTIGAAGGPEEYELYRVFGARRMSDGRIVLMNQGSHELRFYDSDGAFLSRVGREGDGPGEFRRGFYLWVIQGDTLWVGDYAPWRFKVFDPQGRWVRNVEPEPSQYSNPRLMTVLEDGSSVLAAQDLTRISETSLTLREAVPALHSPTGESLDTIGVFPMGRYIRLEGFNVSIYPWFEAFTSLSGAGDRFYIGHGSEPEIFVYQVRPTLRIHSLVRWTAEDRTVTPQDVRAQRAIWRERYEASPPDLVDAMVGDERPLADELPAFSDVVADRDGGFWVERYRRPTEADSSSWLSFDADGNFRCEVTMPPVEIVDLGVDYLLAEQESPLGVEQIVMYRLGEPSGSP